MLARPNILVVGSSNTDMVVFCDRLPKPGETVLGAHRRAMHKALRKFFRWMKREHMIALDPMDEIPPMDEWSRRTAVISVKDFQTILEVCASKKKFSVRVGNQKQPQKTEFSDLLPFFALASFAGLRTKKLVR